MTQQQRQTVPVLGVSIDVVQWAAAITRIASWAANHESRYVCFCNSHSIITVKKDDVFNQAVAMADMATPDGAPVVWMLRRLGYKEQQRINGPDLMWRYCAHAAQRRESIYLYGNTTATLAALQVRLTQAFPGLIIAGSFSPPFRAATEEEDAAIVERINASGAGTVWVSLGCPKQEKWMADHRGSVNAVMLGVGAAFDYQAGTIRRAPLWIQDAGLEWLYRLVTEPRRLWRRYLVTNTLFIWGAARQLLAHRKSQTLPR